MLLRLLVVYRLHPVLLRLGVDVVARSNDVLLNQLVLDHAPTEHGILSGTQSAVPCARLSSRPKRWTMFGILIRR